MLNTISVAPSSLFDDLLCFAEAGIDDVIFDFVVYMRDRFSATEKCYLL